MPKSLYRQYQRPTRERSDPDAACYTLWIVSSVSRNSHTSIGVSALAVLASGYGSVLVGAFRYHTGAMAGGILIIAFAFVALFSVKSRGIFWYLSFVLCMCVYFGLLGAIVRYLLS